jgi:hypothetical protein
MPETNSTPILSTLPSRAHWLRAIHMTFWGAPAHLMMPLGWVKMALRPAKSSMPSQTWSQFL